MLNSETAIVRARWFVVVFMSLYFNLLSFPEWPTGLFNALLGAVALYNFAITVLLQRAPDLAIQLTLIFLSLDTAASGMLIYLTEGVYSHFLFFWYLILFVAGVRFGYARSFILQFAMAVLYIILVGRDVHLTSVESLNYLVFGLFSFAAAALIGSLFRREEQYTVQRLADTHLDAITDRLTGLHNYAYFIDELNREQERASRTGSTYAVVIFDLDHFKQVNDTYGHEKGNTLLASVAALIKASARKMDTVARFGGEEFVILMPDSIGKEMEVAERIRKKVEAAEFPGISDRPLKITISAGACSYPDVAHSALEALDKADLGLYRAKSSGRNRVCYCK